MRRQHRRGRELSHGSAPGWRLRGRDRAALSESARRVGGYNLDAFVNAAEPFNLAKIIVGSEGTLALVAAAKINLVPLPVAKAVLTIEFDDLLDALAATPSILCHRPSAVEVMDRF